MWIGNDIVDLKDPDAQGKADKIRFLKKVCSLEEIESIRKASNPHVSLWTLWAIKEATFKAAQKKDPNARFIPTHFVTSHTNKGWNCEGAYVDVLVTDEFVHAVALFKGDCSNRNLFFRVEKSLGDPSAEVRNLAIRMLDERGFSHCSIIRDKRGGILLPPQILQNGTPLQKADISLSHDGRYFAAALIFCSMSLIASPTV